MKQYHDLLKHILKNGTRHEDRTGVGTISTFGYQTRFDLREGFPIVTTKRCRSAGSRRSCFGFLAAQPTKPIFVLAASIFGKNGRPRSRPQDSGVKQATSGPFTDICGDPLAEITRKQNGVDQIARLINEIETNPNSRRLIVSGWDPRVCDEVALPPCHTLFQFKVDNGTDAALPAVSTVG